MKVTEKKQILITVKAYPNPNREHGETTCCAGIDLSNNQLIRLYPIPFRYLDNDQKFKKYSIIEVGCFHSNEDNRPESFRVNCDTIRVIDYLGTEKKTWQRRKDTVLKVPVKSMCQVRKDAEDGGLSLGIIKPEDISFDHTKRLTSDPRAREVCYTQRDFFKRQIEPIEAIPLLFYYNFKCVGVDDCQRHVLPIVDWEINQAYRDWRKRYPMEEVLLNKIEQRWLDISDTSKKDVYFFVGNLKCNRKTFMVLGVFYPSLGK